MTTYSEQLAAAMDRTREPLVERVRETISENTFTGIVGEAESGKTYILRRARARLDADSWASVHLDLDDAYSPNQLAWTWARELARAVMDPTAFSHMSSLDASMWPSATRGEVVTLAQRIGDEAARMTQAQAPDGTVGSTKQLAELARATAKVAQERGRLVLVVDHLEAQATARGKTPGARDLLWTIRAASQHLPQLHVVAIGRPAAQELATDANAAYHLDGRWLTVEPLTVNDVPGDLAPQEAAAVIAATRGHPAATHELVVEMITGEPSEATPSRPGVAVQTAVGRLAARHASLAGRYLQHARSLHRLGGHLLQVVARGDGPYTGSPNIDPTQIADAMKRLDLAGVVAKPNRRSTEWVIADPRVAWTLTNHPIWIIPTPARRSADAAPPLTRSERADGTLHDLNVALTRWPAVLETKERQLLALLIDGATNDEIAEQLGTSRATVTRQLTRVYDKLGVSGRQEAARQLRAVAAGTE